MSKPGFPVVGAFQGPRHGFATRVLFDGRSLHPLQRLGVVAHTGWPSLGAASAPGFNNAPPAGGPDVHYPHLLDPSITTSMNPAARV